MRIYPFFISHAGCPHRCIFCDQHMTSGGPRLPTPAEVASELRQMLGSGHGGEVAFYGGSFTLLPRRHQEALLHAVRPALESRIICGVRLSTRPDALDEECVAFLASSGVTTVEIGCQSFDAEVLEVCRRGHGPDAAGGALRRLRAAGIRIGLQLMPGLPGGGSGEALRSLETALALRPDFLRIYPAVVLAGTPLAELYRAGRFRPWSVDEAVEVCSVLWRRCRQEQMPIIRMGLQGSPVLDGGEAVLAGPYHPAFGQLVRSRCWLEALQVLGEGQSSTEDRTAYVHAADLSDAIGHRRHNLNVLRRRLGSFCISVCAAIPRGGVRWRGRLFDPLHPAGPMEISS